MLRCNEEGWTEILVPDSTGRRGLWVRQTLTTIELCAGREGDDAYVRLELDPLEQRELLEVIDTFIFAFEN